MAAYLRATATEGNHACFFLNVVDDGFSIVWINDGKLYSDQDCAKLAELFQRELREIIEDAGAEDDPDPDSEPERVIQ